MSNWKSALIKKITQMKWLLKLGLNQPVHLSAGCWLRSGWIGNLKACDWSLTKVKCSYWTIWRLPWISLLSDAYNDAIILLYSENIKIRCYIKYLFFTFHSKFYHRDLKHSDTFIFSRKFCMKYLYAWWVGTNSLARW